MAEDGAEAAGARLRALRRIDPVPEPVGAGHLLRSRLFRRDVSSGERARGAAMGAMHAIWMAGVASLLHVAVLVAGAIFLGVLWLSEGVRWRKRARDRRLEHAASPFGRAEL